MCPTTMSSPRYGGRSYSYLSDEVRQAALRSKEHDMTERQRLCHLFTSVAAAVAVIVGTSRRSTPRRIGGLDRSTVESGTYQEVRCTWPCMQLVLGDSHRWPGTCRAAANRLSSSPEPVRLPYWHHYSAALSHLPRSTGADMSALAPHIAPGPSAASMRRPRRHGAKRPTRPRTATPWSAVNPSACIQAPSSSFAFETAYSAENYGLCSEPQAPS